MQLSCLWSALWEYCYDSDFLRILQVFKICTVYTVYTIVFAAVTFHIPASLITVHTTERPGCAQRSSYDIGKLTDMDSILIFQF